MSDSINSDLASAPPRIERPPEARSFEVEKLMELAKQGRLRIPHFQRAFRWKNADRIALFDSIERGYPIGTLLFWKRSATVDGGIFEDAEPGPLTGDAYWIVDGQQRIKTLWDALARRPVAGEPSLCFDLNGHGQFRFLNSSDAASRGCVPLHVVLDATELSQWLVSNNWPPEKMRRAFDLGKRIRQYSVPAYVVESDAEIVLRHIFDRTNSTGKALTRDEVFDALAGTALGQGEKGLDQVNDRLADYRFGGFDRGTILNAFEAIRNLRIGKVPLHTIASDDVPTSLDATVRALSRVIDFLRSSAHVQHAVLVPYELPIVVLARFFHLFPDASQRSRILLRRWLWRASLSQQLTGASGSLQEHVDDVVAGDEHGSVQRLLHRSGSSQRTLVDLTELRPLSVGTALGRLQVCALVAMRPRDLITGETLDIGDLFANGLERSVRKIVKTPEADNESILGRTIANRLVHTPTRGVGAARLLLDTSDVGALASHGIDSDSIRALRAGDVQTFLEVRAKRLTGWTSNFFNQHSEWGADDTAPVSVLRRRS